MTNVTHKQSKIRRPEVARLAEKLQARHPNWSWEACVVEAKKQVTQ